MSSLKHLTAQLINAFVFTSQIIKSLPSYLNPKCQGSSHLLCLYRPVLFLTWSETPKARISCVVAHTFFVLISSNILRISSGLGSHVPFLYFAGLYLSSSLVSAHISSSSFDIFKILCYLDINWKKNEQIIVRQTSH